MERLSPLIVGGALAITAAALYSVCAAAFAIAPAATLGFFDAWFHGLNLAGLQAGAKPFTLGVFVYGLVGLTVSAFVSGAVFAVSYNLLRLCPGCRDRK
jgi:hypothetical protein